MKRYLKLPVLCALCICISYVNVYAQKPNRTPGKFPSTKTPDLTVVPPPANNEVTGEADEAKEKSNEKNYSSNGILKFTAEYMRWFRKNSIRQGLPSSRDLADDYSSSNTFAIANTNNYFSFGIGIAIAARGGKFTGNASNNILYAQIPVMVRYSYITNSGATLFANAGPYYGIAVSGNYKDNTGKTKFKFGDKPGDDFRRGDFGLKFGIGYKLQAQPIFIALVTDMGLRNIVPGGGSQIKIKNQSFGLQVGYVF